MRVLETRYGGCHFRSRLEARWAVAFDAMGVRWDYEPEGYALPSGPYLPDFYIRTNEPVGDDRYDDQHDPGFWCEIKPTAPTSHECNLLQELSTATRKVGCFLAGTMQRGVCLFVFPQEPFPFPVTMCVAKTLNTPELKRRTYDTAKVVSSSPPDLVTWSDHWWAAVNRKKFLALRNKGYAKIGLGPSPFPADASFAEEEAFSLALSHRFGT